MNGVTCKPYFYEQYSYGWGYTVCCEGLHMGSEFDKNTIFSVTSILNDFRDKTRKFVVRNKQGCGKLEFSLDAIKCYGS